MVPAGHQLLGDVVSDKTRGPCSRAHYHHTFFAAKWVPWSEKMCSISYKPLEAGLLQAGKSNFYLEYKSISIKINVFSSKVEGMPCNQLATKWLVGLLEMRYVKAPGWYSVSDRARSALSSGSR